MGKLVNPFEELTKTEQAAGAPTPGPKKTPGRLKNPFEAGAADETPPQRQKPAPKAASKLRSMFEQKEEIPATTPQVGKPGKLRSPFEQSETSVSRKSTAPADPRSVHIVKKDSTALVNQKSSIVGSESGSVVDGQRLSQTQEGQAGEFTLVITEDPNQRSRHSNQSDTSSVASGLLQSLRAHSRAPSVIMASPVASRKQSLVSQLSGVDWKLTAQQNRKEVLELQFQVDELKTLKKNNEETIKEIQQEVDEKRKQLQQADSMAGGETADLREQLDDRDRELRRVKNELEVSKKRNSELARQNKNFRNSESSLPFDELTVQRLQAAEQMVANLRSQLQSASSEITRLEQRHPDRDLEISNLTQKLDRSRDAVLQATERAFESDTKLIESRKMLYRLMNPLERGTWDDISSTPSSIDGCVEHSAERLVEEKCKNVIKGFGETTSPVQIYRGGMAPGEDYLPKPPTAPTALDSEPKKQTIDVPPPPQQPMTYAVGSLGGDHYLPCDDNQTVSKLLHNYDQSLSKDLNRFSLSPSPSPRTRRRVSKKVNKSESASPKRFSSEQMNEFNTFTTGVMRELKFPQTPHLR